MKVKTTIQHIALIQGAFSAFGQDETVDGAIKRLCRELRDCGIKATADISFMVYTCAIGNQISWDDRGVHEVHEDKEIGVATPAHWITDCVVGKPLTTMRLNDWREGYMDGGKAMEALLQKRAA